MALKSCRGVINDRGEILHKFLTPLHSAITTQDIIQTILRFYDEIKRKFEYLTIDCVGAAIPGLADAKNGIWIYSSFSGIKDFKIAEIVSDALKLPVFIQNDVTACAYGEKIYGNCQGIDDFIWVTVSNGIGGGLVLNGEVYEGAFKNAGEIGHISVVDDGIKCKCGNKGCLEAYASGASLARIYNEKVMLKYGHGSYLNAKEVAMAARQGDALAIEVYKETGCYLGKGISYAVNLLNLQKVVIGGGVTNDMDLFMPELQRVANEMIFKQANKNLRIVKTSLDYEAALIGAAAIAQKGMGRIN